jgi:hypothetical protein
MGRSDAMTAVSPKGCLPCREVDDIRDSRKCVVIRRTFTAAVEDRLLRMGRGGRSPQRFDSPPLVSELNPRVDLLVEAEDLHRR